VELAGLKSERSQTMTDTIDDVAADPVEQEPAGPAIDEQGVAEQLVAQAREKGIELVGPNGLLSQLTKRVLETALEAEMSEHLGYDRHDPAGRNHGNSRNGVRSKTVLTVNTVLQRVDSHLRVQVGRHTDDDRIDAAASQHRQIIVVKRCCGILRLDELSRRRVSVADGTEVHVGDQAVGDQFGVHRSLRAQADDAESRRISH
jgi:hypothetical protein